MPYHPTVDVTVCDGARLPCAGWAYRTDAHRTRAIARHATGTVALRRRNAIARCVSYSSVSSTVSAAKSRAAASGSSRGIAAPCARLTARCSTYLCKTSAAELRVATSSALMPRAARSCRPAPCASSAYSHRTRQPVRTATHQQPTAHGTHARCPQSVQPVA